MMTLLPLIALIFLVSLVKQKKAYWRPSILSGLVIFGVILTLITEILSLFKKLNLEFLFLAWLLVDIILIYISRKKINPRQLAIKVEQRLPLFSTLLIVSVVFIVTIVGVIALVAAPNNWDSMIYHLSRVAHWMQNQSVAHYPTHTLKQLYQNPWAEFAIMHLQILSGGDRFANLVQWGSMVGSLVGVSLIAKQLGANLRGQIFAVVFCATIPMGILQGSSTQNDYVLAFWLVCLAHFTLLTVQEGTSLNKTLGIGASLGLAILTKGSAYIYGLPFCLWLGFWGIKKMHWQVWKPIVIVGLLVLAINLGHYTRNFTLFGSPLGTSAAAETMGEFSLSIFISNVLRNLALHADIVRNLGLQDVITPTTGITNKLIEIVHNWLGLDISNPRTTSPAGMKFHVPGLSRHEDTAGNPVHLLLIFGSFILLFINKRLRNKQSLIIYACAVSFGFLLFCFLLTWSPWRSRLHLPLFVLLSSFVGVIFSKSLNYRIVNFLAVILIVLSHSWVFNNAIKPLVGSKNILAKPRLEQYFVSKPYLELPYREGVEQLQSLNCAEIGLIDRISHEYPFWVLLEKSWEKFKIIHIKVDNQSSEISKQIPYRTFNPCAVVTIASEKEQNIPETTIDYHDNSYKLSWGKDAVKIFTKTIDEP